MEQRRTVFRPLVLALFLIGMAGCARESVPAKMAPASVYPSANEAYAWPPATLGAAPVPPSRPLVAGIGVAAGEPPSASAPAPGRPRQPPAPSTAPPANPPATPTPRVDPVIPSGDACLAALEGTGIAYHRLDSKKGVETPIVVTGPIDGIHFDGGSGGGVVADCRLALALHRVAPILKRIGVTRMRYSGAYSYRMSKVGRLSYHAYGLAIDVHEFVVGGKRLSVEADFARGLADGCANSSPPLNRVACQLKATGVFKELLTPDYNADHHNHMHFGIAPLRPAEPPTAPRATPHGAPEKTASHAKASVPRAKGALKKHPKAKAARAKAPETEAAPERGTEASQKGSKQGRKKAASKPRTRQAKRKAPPRS